MSNTFFPAVQYQQLYQPESMLSDLAKAAAIRSAQQQQRQSEQAFPVEQQQRQEQLTTAQLANQQTRIQMQDKQGIAQALRDSYGGPQAGSVSTQIAPSLGGASQPSSATPASGPTAAPNAPATPPTQPSAPASQPSDPTERLKALVNRIQDPKYGISLPGQMALIQQFTEMGQKAATLDKTTTDNLKEAHEVASRAYNSVLEAAPEDQAAQWTLERNQMLRSGSDSVKAAAAALPAQYPGQPAPGGSPEAQTAVHSLMAEQDIVAAAKSKAELPGEQAKSQQLVQAAARPTPQQISDATKTIQSYEGINPAERLGLIAEINHAPDFETLQKVQARADAAQSSGQMKQASLAQARAMMGNKFAEAGLTQNDKIWTDPQRGFSGALAQANQTKNSIQAGVDGNGLLTSMVPTMEVLGINHAAGISRISPAEAAAAGTPPEWATRWNAWATAAASGKLTPKLAQQGQQLMDVVIDAAHQRAIQSSQLIAKGHGIDPTQMPAMDRQGNLTTLDQAAKPQQKTQQQGMVTMKAPNGQTKPVPADQVEHYKSMGATVVGP